MVPICHIPLQEATKAQRKIQLSLCVSGTSLSPSHVHCFGFPVLVGSPLLMPVSNSSYQHVVWPANSVLQHSGKKTNPFDLWAVLSQQGGSL